MWLLRQYHNNEVVQKLSTDNYQQDEEDKFHILSSEKLDPSYGKWS